MRGDRWLHRRRELAQVDCPTPATSLQAGGMAIWLSTPNGLERSAPESLQRQPPVGTRLACRDGVDGAHRRVHFPTRHPQEEPAGEAGRAERWGETSDGTSSHASSLALCPWPCPLALPSALSDLSRPRPRPPPTSARHRSSTALLPAGRWWLLPGAGTAPPPPRRLAAPLQRVWTAARHAGRLWGPLELGLRERAGALLEPRLDLILRVCV